MSSSKDTVTVTSFPLPVCASEIGVVESVGVLPVGDTTASLDFVVAAPPKKLNDPASFSVTLIVISSNVLSELADIAKPQIAGPSASW